MKKKNSKTMKVSLLLWMFISVSAFSNEMGRVSLFSLPFNEVIEMEIEVASKVPEKLYEAPSTVSVFSKKQIEQMGIENVYDLLNFVPGFSSTRSVDLADESLIHVRGLAQIDGKVLFLLNGHRLNESSFGRATLYNRYISTANVKRVEIIRGPGSALYGSNAFLGVVNIITEHEVNCLSVQSGSNGQIAGHLNVHHNISDESAFSASFGYIEDKGETLTLYNGGETKDPKENINFYSRYSYLNLNIDLSYMEYEGEDFISFNSTAPGQNWSNTKYFLASISDKWEVSDKLTVFSRLSYTQHNIELIGLLQPASNIPSSFDLFSGPYSESQDYEVSLNLNYTIDDTSKIISGISYNYVGVDYLGAYTNHLTSDGFQIAPREQFYLGGISRFKDIGQLDSRERFQDIYGIFSEYIKNFSKNFNAILGVRYDYYSVAGGSVNPRLGLIYTIDGISYFKLLYGSAFRSPTNQELFTNSPRSSGNEGLEAEEVQTLELIYGYKNEQLNFETVFFSNSLSNIIESQIAGAADGRNTWVNVGEETFEGVEISLKAEINENVRLMLIHTSIFSDVALNTYKDWSAFVLNFDKNKINFNLNGIYRAQESGTIANQDDYFVVNSKLIYQVKKDMNLYITVFNLLDEEYYTYETKLNSQNNAVPNRGSEIKAGVEIKW